MQQIKKMGGIGDILKMMPGMGGQIKDTDVDEGALPKQKPLYIP